MPVQVQLPGYNRNVIGENIANIANAGASAYHNYKESNLADENTKQKQLQNTMLAQQAQQENDFKKAADTPGTPQSDALKAQHSILASTFEGSGLLKGAEGKAALSDWKKQIVNPEVSGYQLDQMTQKNTAMKEVTDLVKAKMSAEAMGAKFSGMNKTREEANQMRANTAYDNIIGKKYEDRLDASQRLSDIISKARSGELIPTENLGQQIATDINLLQAGHTTVSGTEHSTPKTGFGAWGKLVHYGSGAPQAAITDGDLAQMEKENNTLYNDIGKQHESKFSSWVKGQPTDIQPLLRSRFQESRAQYFPQGSAGAKLDAEGGKGSGTQAPDPKSMTREQKIKLLQGG